MAGEIDLDPQSPTYGLLKKAPTGTSIDASGVVTRPKTEVSMIDTGSAISQVNKQNSYLNSTYPVANNKQGGAPAGWDTQTYNNFKAANPNLEPDAEDTRRMQNAGGGKAYFTNTAGQEAEYTQEQLSDPNTQQFLKNNGYVLTKSDGVNVGSDFSVSKLQSGYDQAANEVENLSKEFLSYNVDQDPAFQAQSQNIKNNFSKLKSEIEKTNAQRQRAFETLGMRYQTSQYAGDIQMSIEGEELTQANERIAELTRQESEAISAARTAYETGKYAKFNAQVTALKDIRDQKATQLADYNKKIADAIANQAKQRELELQQQNQEFNQNVKLVEIGLASDKFNYEQKKDLFEQTMANDKFTWEQKQDLIRNSLENAKFTYQQKQDAKEYALKLAAAERADNPTSYDEWSLAGGIEGTGKTYAQFLMDGKGKPVTADQDKNAGFALRMKAANDNISVLTEKWKTLGYLGQKAQFSEFTPNFLKSGETQQMEQAQRDFINAVLRRESGAAIATSEFENAKRQYFPMPGDRDDVLKQKEENRRLALQGVAQSAGPALTDEFKESLNKTTYSSIQQFKDLNSERWAEVENIIRSEGITNEVDALRLINRLESMGKTEPLTMGENWIEQAGKLGGLGDLSAKFESSGDPGIIGWDSTGGLSYGTYQLAHNNALNFVNQSPYRQEFSGLKFNSKQWQNKWKEVARKDPEGFKQAQQGYIEKTHYEPQVNKLAKQGIDITQYSPVFKDVIFSTAVQHGANNDVIEKAIKKVGKNASEAQIIKAIYEERWNGGRRFASSTPAVRKSVYNRFFGKNGELSKALSMLKGSYNNIG